jgi:hypothetical protein
MIRVSSTTTPRSCDTAFDCKRRFAWYFRTAQKTAQAERQIAATFGFDDQIPR